MSPKVAVVILNYNTRYFLEKFLPFVMATDYDNLEIVVSDNASKDDTLDFLMERYPGITKIALEKNYGYAGGYNHTLNQIEADYYVLLNSDVEVPPNWLRPLVDLAESNSKIAAIQPKLIDYKDRSLFEYAGGSGGFIDQYGYPFCRGRWFHVLEKDQGQYNDTREIFWASGACLFIRVKCFREMGGLDEDFFAHMEEIDLCWRLKNAGYTIMVCPESKVYHVGGGTLPVGNPRKTYLNFRNGLFLLLKNVHGSVLFKTLLMRLALDGLAGVKFPTEFKFREIGAILKAHWIFYKRRKYFLRKRNLISSEMLQPTGMYQKSMVMEFFLHGKRKFSDTGL